MRDGCAASALWGVRSPISIPPRLVSRMGPIGFSLSHGMPGSPRRWPAGREGSDLPSRNSLVSCLRGGAMAE